MAKKSITSLGIEYDNFSIRAAKITSARLGKEIKISIDDLFEFKGDYAKEETLQSALASAGKKANTKLLDRVITCVCGRQVFVSQVKFKNMPAPEMKKALRSEIRKNMTFESVGSALDYQIMDDGPQGKSATPDITVTAVTKPLIDYQMRVLDKAGLKPTIVDVLPAAIANSFWVSRKDTPLSRSHVMTHFSPDTCTVVIDGVGVPFYTRSIHFKAEECFGPLSKDKPSAEKHKQLDILAEELKRSLSYYTTNHGIAEFGPLCPVGNYLENEELFSLFNLLLGIEVEASTIIQRLGSSREAVPGKFDVALALALRGNDNL